MAAWLDTRSLLLAKPRQALTSLLSSIPPFSSAPASRLAAPPPSLLPPPVAAAPPLCRPLLRGRVGSPLLGDPNPDWRERPPGCDLEHWLVVMEKPEGDPTRDDIIDSYIKTLAQVVGSEEEARMKIYSVSTRHCYAFGALVSEELSHKLKDLPRVQWVRPDSYLDDKNKDYGGEPFVNGQAVPYDPKYHEGRERNITPANKRNTIICLPSIFDRSSNFERKRENMQSRDFQGQDICRADTSKAGTCHLCITKDCRTLHLKATCPHQIWAVEWPHRATLAGCLCTTKVECPKQLRRDAST
ncbi:hypothetical protein NL676_000605 [Syzygium grande]|nr:hypothetical protein NL676_000605 [Syzygium grande]